MSELLLMCATRNRPAKFERYLQAFVDTHAEVDLIAAVDDDDPQLEAYQQIWENRVYDFNLRIGPRRRLVGTLNEVAMSDLTAGYPYIGWFGDDQYARTEHWDQRMLAELKDIGTGAIVYGDDTIQGPNLPSQIIGDRRIFEALGWFLMPKFIHLYTDNVWLDIGRALGTMRYLPDILIEHEHPANGKAEWDEVYRDTNSHERYLHDKAAYELYVETQLRTDVARVKTALGL